MRLAKNREAGGSPGGDFGRDYRGPRYFKLEQYADISAAGSRTPSPQRMCSPEESSALTATVVSVKIRVSIDDR